MKPLLRLIARFGSLLPGACAVVGAVVFWIVVPQGTPWVAHLIVGFFAAGTFGLGLWTAMLRRRDLRVLTAAARDLANGRIETRAPLDIAPGLEELARQLNTLGQHLGERREQLQQRFEASTTRLRQDLVRAQQQLTAVHHELSSLHRENRQQSELFSGLVHELRTPLTAILGFADLLRKTRLDDDQADYIATVDRSARGLLSMLNDVLDWSRIEAGRLKLQEERFDLADAVEDVVALLAPLAYEKQLEIVHIVYHDVPLQLDGDAQRLRQVLTNLLSNAIKFTDHGEVVLRVMKERSEPGRVALRCLVSDTGRGMTPEQRERLFRPYEQLSAQHSANGSGLGLTIVKKLAELMSGDVSVESEPGRGSTFSVLLQFQAATGSVPAWNRLRDRRIWLVERHPAARLALSHSLQFWGVDVQAFEDAAQLVTRLRNAVSGRPDVVIAGLQPADLSEPALRQLGALCMEAHPPLLALLASVSPVLQQDVIDLGAARSLPKSVSRLQLYRELCELAGSGKSSPLLEGKQLLLADNNNANRRYLAMLARELGAQVQSAADGSEALQMWEAQRFDYALVDYRMPGLDGAQLIRMMRSGESGTRTRLVAISAHLSPEERQSLRQAGADQVLIKPFDEAQLLRALSPGLSLEAEDRGIAERLSRDAEMLSLLREELPLQLRELEHAFIHGDAVAARAAAHTLSGTAAFYHLTRLKNAARDMEQQLAASAFSGVPTNGLERLRAAVTETLGEMR